MAGAGDNLTRSAIYATLSQVLKLESVAGGGSKDSSAAATAADGGRGTGGSNLSMNQTLEGHEGSVVSTSAHKYIAFSRCDIHQIIWFDV